MQLNRRPNRFSAHRLAAVATTILLAVAAPFSPQAQTPPFPTPLPMCAAPPSPQTDGWPVAAADSLGSTPGTPVTFSGASLLSNDTGVSLTLTGVDAVGSNGGSITGAGPFTYTPATLFMGTETFSYEISDAAAQTAIGIVTVIVTVPAPDVVAPSVSIAAPLGGSVSGMVLVSASASDNIGVAGVSFFDGATPIGSEVSGTPFQVTWNTTLVADGSHSLSAVARDAAGNTATSASVVVTVANATTVPNLVGLTSVPAQGAIAAAGLTVGTITAVNSPAPDGQVISQSPASGSIVPLNTAVAFTLSLGPALVTVPSVVGMVQATAQSTITGVGLTVGAVTSANSATVAAGKVISQNPVAGNSVPLSSAVALVVSTGPATTGVPAVDKMVFSEGLGKRTTAAFSTTAPGEVLVAFAASDGPPSANSQTLTIAGAGLSWTRVRRAATRFGDSEIWTATAPSVLTNVTVSSTQSSAGVHQSLTVIAFTGVGGVGASNVGGAINGASSVSLATTAAGSVVYGVGNDWDRAVARTIPAGQTKVHEFVDTAVGDTFWVQAANGTTGPVGSTVTLNATAPTNDQWNAAIVELKPGAAPVMVTVPSVVGLTQAAAQTTITGAGLTVGVVTTANSASVPAGKVISQTPASGASVAQNSSVALVVSLGAALGGPVVDKMVFSDGTGARTTAPFNTAGAGEVLVAFATSDGPTSGANTQTLTVSGAGLAWTRVQRAAIQRGVAEIWTATAPGALTNATVTSTQSVTVVLGAAVNQSLTVVAFTGASGVGASNVAGAASGAPQVSLVTQAAGSVVYAVGNDFDLAVARVIPAGQTKVHEFFAPTGDTFWVQSADAVTAAAGATVTLNVTAPTTDQWNFAIVEVKR
jgi:beta-lactam-binding protein with PASTA domain